jgi:hypothetical protein
MKRLSPAFRARAQAVCDAHAHLKHQHPDWHRLSPQERIRAVHQHVDRPRGTLASRLLELRRQRS